MDNHEGKDLTLARKNSLVLMIFTLISRILGIVKARVIATVFGLTGTADIINFTFNIPNNFRKLFAEGAFNSAFIPEFTRLIVEKRGEKELLRNLLGFQFVIMLPLIILTFIFRRPIIVFLSDFSGDQSLILAGNLLAYFSIYLALITFYSLFAGVLQSHQTFLVASIAPLIFSVCVIASVSYLSRYYGPYSMVIGVIIGGAGQVLFTVAKVRSLDYDIRISFNFRSPDVRRVLRRWVPVTFSSLIAIVTQQAAYYFATTLQEGSVTAFSNAIIVYQAPYGIFYAAIATSFFPSLSIAFNQNNRQRLRELSDEGIAYLLSFLIPSAILLIVWRSESCAVLFSGGNYSVEDAVKTGEVLLYFAIGMPFIAVYGFLQRLSYSADRFRMTVYIAFVVSICDILLTIFLLGRTNDVSSIALANTIALSAGLVIYTLVLSRSHIYSLLNISLLKKLAKIISVNIPLAAISYLMKMTVGNSWWINGSSFSSFLILAGIYLTSALMTLGVYRIFKIDIGIFFKNKERE
ncbi:MAG: murein biosynthesis integral membrane protein MurJ [Sphaerochaetaceae bacterium]